MYDEVSAFHTITLMCTSILVKSQPETMSYLDTSHFWHRQWSCSARVCQGRWTWAPPPRCSPGLSGGTAAWSNCASCGRRCKPTWRKRMYDLLREDKLLFESKNRSQVCHTSTLACRLWSKGSGQSEKPAIFLLKTVFVSQLEEVQNFRSTWECFLALVDTSLEPEKKQFRYMMVEMMAIYLAHSWSSCSSSPSLAGLAGPRSEPPWERSVVSNIPIE